MKLRNYLTAGVALSAVIAGILIWNANAGTAAAQLGTVAENVVAATEYNARDEFALTQGGSNGVWNYGYSASDTDNTLTLFSSATDTDTVAGCSGGNFERWRINNPDTIPQIARHNPALTCSNVPSNALFIHPGFSGQRAVVRWTAPVSGTFQVTGSLQRQNTGATTDLKVIVNAATPSETVVFAGNNSSTFQISYNVNVTVAAGDKLDFSVGNGNGTQIGDGSSIAINISAVANACLTAPANLQVNVPAENSPSDVASVNPNASLVGDAVYTSMGKVGRAFEFDGSGDYVRIDDNAAQRPATAVTAEGWFKFDSVGNVSLISKPLRNSALNSYTLYLDGGQLRGLVSNGPQYTRVFSNFTPQTGVWHHLAFTYDLTGGVSTLKLYANGVEVTTSQDGTPNIPMAYDANPFPLLIGGEYETNAPVFYLDGQADEVAVYGRALSASEIFGIVKAGAFGKCGPAACVQAPNNLVSWFAGEGNATDSKSGNHGTLVNGATFQAAKVGSGMKFDGANDFVEVPDDPSLRPTTLTLDTWLKFDSLTSTVTGGAPTGYQNIIFKKNSRTAGTGFEGGYSLVKNPDNRLGIGFNSASGGTDFASSTTVVQTGVWYHIAATHDGTNIRLYVNGQLEGTGTANFPIDYGTTPLYLGTAQVPFTGYFSGVLDETSIYNRALTANEVQSIFTAGSSGKCKPIAPAPASNQIAWFTADGDTRDFKTLNPNGILRGDAKFAVGKIGQSFSLDGVGDYVEVPDDADHRPATQLTAEGWFRFNNFNSLPHLIAKGLRGNDRDSYVMWFANNNIRVGYSDSASNMFVYDTGFTPKAGEWNHYAMVLNTDDAGLNANTFKLYVNGAEVFSGAAGGPVFYDTVNPHPLTIGADINNDIPDFLLNGLADEVSLYSRALTASEIGAIYSAGSAGKEKSAAVSASATYPLADASVTLAGVTTPGTVSQSGGDLGLLPALPAGMTFTGIAYDVSTTAAFTGATLCFNVPSLSGLTFANLRVLHLENGAWVNRTATGGTAPNLCTSTVTSFSPFVIAASTPTSADVSLGGRVATPTGAGLMGAVVTLTDAQGNARQARTTFGGRYGFDGLKAGEVYFVSVTSKKVGFSNATRAVNLTDSLADVDFIGTPVKR